MNNVLNAICLSACMVLATSIHAREYERGYKAYNDKKSIDFIENKGQWLAAIQYKADIPGGTMFLTNAGFVYNYISHEDMARLHDRQNKGGIVATSASASEVVHGHAYKVNFEGVNKHITYNTTDERSYYHNYFVGNDSSKWKGRVGLYGTIEQRNVYKGIDIKVYSDNIILKYDFIVAPGADPRQIVLSFDGVVPELTPDGNLRIKTTVNEVIEKKPYTYQEIDGRQIVIKSDYKLSKGKLTFSFPEGYNKQYPLVIDPDLIFATYSGSFGTSKYAHSTTYDKDKNVYAAALTSGGGGWPTTPGAYQTTYYSLPLTAAINKYSADGSTLLYSTYFAGQGFGNIQPNTLMVNAANELFMAGNVSDSTMPVTAGVYQPVKKGHNDDMYIAHFSSDGSTLLGATFIGGTDQEAGWMPDFYIDLADNFLLGTPTDIVFDNTGNLWVASNSCSADFPITSNAYRSTINGRQNAVLFKISPDLSTILYSTFLGAQQCLSIAYDANHNTIGVVGMANGNLPTTPGAYKTASPGYRDGFAVLMDNATSTVKACTYLGTIQSDVAMRLAFDCAGNFYVAGRTDGDYPFTSLPNEPYLHFGSVFVDKLTPDLSASIASTRTGGTKYRGTCFPTALAVDACGNVLLSTIGYQFISDSFPVKNMPVTPDAFNKTPTAFYFAEYEPDFTGLIFGTYFGTLDDHFHLGVARIDPEGVIYHSVCSGSGTFPTTPGAFAPTKQTNIDELDDLTFKFKIGRNLAINTKRITGGGANARETHCVRGCRSAYIDFTRIARARPVTVHYLISGDAVNGVDYQWIPDSIVIGANKSTATLEIKPLLVPAPTLPDPRHVIITTLEPCNCNGNKILSIDTVWIYDSLYVKIQGPSDTVCPGTQITISAEIDSTLKFIWSPVNLIPDPTQLTIHPTPKTTTIFRITVVQQEAPSTCPPRTKMYIANVEPNPELVLSSVKACPLIDSLDIAVHALPGNITYRYQWSPPDYLRNEYDPNNRFLAPVGEYRKVITAISPRNCSSMDSFIITILPPFRFDRVLPSDTTINYGDAIQLNSESNAVSWSWQPGRYLDAAAIQNPIARPLSSIEYTLIGTDLNGCADTALVRINVEYHSRIGIPDAFTPNSDGKNDIFRIVNVKYEKLLRFKIFNRYGDLVFETQDPQEGWDGTYKGVPADIGVYYYLVEMVLPLSNGSKVFKGDVTLIR